jgi:hypothetical protein
LGAHVASTIDHGHHGPTSGDGCHIGFDTLPNLPALRRSEHLMPTLILTGMVSWFEFIDFRRD